MPVVYETPFVRLHVTHPGPVLETEWLTFCNSDELRNALMESLRLAEQHGVRGWIGNNRQMRTIRPVDQDWMNHDWFPLFARLGIRRLAVVVSDDALNRMGVEHILQRATAHTPHDTHYFTNPEQAREWAADLTMVGQTATGA